MGRRVNRFVLVVLLAACVHHSENQVTLPAQPLASATATDADDDAGAPAYAMSAESAFHAAERLQRDGMKAESRAAFADLLRKFPYSRFAKEAQLRVAQIDDSPDELRQWVHDHPKDERVPGIVAKLDTLGDVTCRDDADCAVTTKRDCCECCPRRAVATSKKWLEWRERSQCPAVRCAPCEESCKPETGARAACTGGKCTLVR